MVEWLRGKRRSYDLDAIHAAVKLGAFILTRKAARDAESLGYTRTDVQDCLSRIEPTHFYKSYGPEDGYEQGRCDAYRYKNVGPNGTTDYLYIKLKLVEVEGAMVTVVSFHLNT